MAPISWRDERRTLPSAQLARIQNIFGSRSSTELRSGGRPTQEPNRSASLTDLLPPVELRGVRALQAPEPSSSNSESVCTTSQAPSGVSGTAAGRPSSAALVAAAVLRSPSRCVAPSCSDTDSDGDVSQFTASSCSTVRGHGYAKSDSSRGSNRGLILGRRARPLKSKRWSSSSKRKEDCICCPRGHELVLSERYKAWFCHGCGRVSSTTQMDCFRCNRCNYNLCDQCYNAQVSDHPSASLRRSPRRSSSKVSSAPTSVDELLARASSESALPGFPPGFSRQLSPSTPECSIAGSTAGSWHQSMSQMSTKSSWRSAGHGRSKSRSKSPQDKASSDFDSRRSSLSSASSAANPRHGLVDPMLRIVSLSEWFVQSGWFAQAADAVAGLSAEEKAIAAKDLADIMVKGFSFGSPGSSASRKRARRQQLQAMSGCRFLPLEDVQEALKIWHMTLVRRPSRKHLALQYGRVERRDNELNPDADLLARMLSEQGVALPCSNKPLGLPSQTGGDGLLRGNSGSSGQSGSSLGGFGFNSRGTAGMRGSLTGESGSNDFGFSDPLGGLGRNSDPKVGGNDIADSGSQDQSGVRRDSVRSSKRSSLKNGEGEENEGNDAFDLGDPRLRVDAEHSEDRVEEEKKLSSPGRRAPQAQLASSEHQKVEVKAENLKCEKEGVEQGSDEAAVALDSEAELLASGALFRIKQIVAEVILEEFACSLFPAPTLMRSVNGRSPAGQESESTPDSFGDITPSPSGRLQRRRSSMQSSKIPPVQPTAIPSSLAQDFRKCLEDAFRVIEYPEEAKLMKKHVDTSPSPELMADFQEDPELQRLLTRSNTSMHFKSDATLLEQHLQFRAERHSRRLQNNAKVALRGKQDRWPRRLASCQQSLKMTSPLDAFAELRGLARVATA